MAENGQVALDFTESRSFDAILMDMQMPVLDGYMATKLLRQRGVNVPIIALTAHSMKGDEERRRAAGCSGYITKPINSECLLNTLAAVLPVRDTAACEPCRNRKTSRSTPAWQPRTPRTAKSWMNLWRNFVRRIVKSSAWPPKSALRNWRPKPIGSRDPAEPSASIF